MSKKNSKGGSLGEALRSVFTVGAMIVALAFSYFLYKYVFGNPLFFEGGNPDGNPLPNNYLAIIYKGGIIVPFLIALNLILVIFAVERGITLFRAKGKGRINVFVKNLQNFLDSNKIEDAVVACDKQKGSLANVMKAGLLRYRSLQNDPTLEKDQKILALQKEFEEASALELPMLSRNLVILSTIASISVLTGLMGTVLGMIKAFAALAQAGAPDALALANGISEALINTAFGIFGSLLAIVLYNFYSTQIDSFTYKIDEAGFSLVQSFAAATK
jgi:biopolymer transport protein ExbB